MAPAARRVLTQHLLPQHVAQLETGFVDCHVTRIDFSRNKVAIKIVTCNITLNVVHEKSIKIAQGN